MFRSPDACDSSLFRQLLSALSLGILRIQSEISDTLRSRLTLSSQRFIARVNPSPTVSILSVTRSSRCSFSFN